MRFIFSPFGSAGDVYPMLGPAIELKRRGHEVTFVTNGYFQEAVARHGIEYVELGTKQEFLDSTANADLWHPMRGFRHVYESLIVIALRRQYEAFERLFQRGATLGVVNVFGFGGLVAREKLGLPIVTLHVQPAVIWSRIEPPRLPGIRGPRWLQDLQFRVGERVFIDRIVCPRLNDFRRELGLPRVQRIAHWWHSPGGIVCPFPEWFCPVQADWPAGAVQTDFPLWDEQSDEMPCDIEAFLADGRPPLVFTPGTGNQFGAKFFGAAVDACQRLQRRGILCSKFAEHIPTKLPTNVLYAPYAPFSRLLPRSAGVVHHGGVGTTAQALAAGVPQLIMPLAHDQFDNAARVRRLGVGDSLAPQRFTGARLACKLEALLSNSRVGDVCRRLAGRLASRDGCARTADVLEAMARGRVHNAPARVTS